MWNNWPYTNMQELNLDWILQKLKDFETRLDTVLEGLEDKLKIYIDGELATFQASVNAQLNSIRSDISTIRGYVDSQVSQIRNENTQLKNYVDGQIANTIARVDSDLSALRLYVVQETTALRLLINNNNEELKDYVDTEIQKVIDMIPEITSVYVKNPLTGNVEPIQETLDYTNNAYLCEALTAIDYNIRAWSAEYYDSLLLDAFTYDRKAREIYRYNSPFSGYWFSNYEFLTSLTDLHKKLGIFADNYDNIGYDADTYDGFDISAYQYDFYGFLNSKQTGETIKTLFKSLYPENDINVYANLAYKDDGYIIGFISISLIDEPESYETYKKICPLCRSNNVDGTIKTVGYFASKMSHIYSAYIITIDNIDWICTDAEYTDISENLYSDISISYY